jgi:hypothetical protein
MARCAVRRVQRRNIRCDSHVLDYSFSPLNAGCDGAARHPYQHAGSFKMRRKRPKRNRASMRAAQPDGKADSL